MEKEIKAFEKYLGRKLGLGNKSLIESFIEFRALNSDTSEAHSERSEANEGESLNCDCTHSQACRQCYRTKDMPEDLWNVIEQSED